MDRPPLTLIVKPNCRLCDQARETVQAVAGEFGLLLSELSIAEDRELAARHAEEVPVLLIDGVSRDFWYIDPHRLRRLLRARELDAGLGRGEPDV